MVSTTTATSGEVAICAVASMPPVPRHLQVHQDDVRAFPIDGGDRRGARVDRGDHHHRVVVREHGLQPLPEDRVVVGHDDPQRCGHGFTVSGMVAMIDVRPGLDSTVRRPPSSSARSRMLSRPTCGSASAGRPDPSSQTSMRSTSGSARRATSHREPPECRIAFATASLAIRYAATSTAAGSAVHGAIRRHRHLRTGHAAELLPEGVDKPELVQRWGSQVIHSMPHVGDGGPYPVAQRACPAGQLGLVVQSAHEAVELQGQTGELRSHPVVEVAAQPATLLLARGDDPLPTPPYVLEQPGRLNQRPGALRHVSQHRPLLGGEPVRATAKADHEHGSLLAEGVDRHVLDVLDGLAGGDRVEPGRAWLDGDVRDAQRAAQLVGQAGECLDRARSRVEPLADALDDRVRVASLTVEQPVDQRLQPVAPERQEQGERGHRDDADALLGSSVDADYSGEIDEHQQPGEEDVHEGPVEHDLDIQELVAADGDHDASRDRCAAKGPGGLVPRRRERGRDRRADASYQHSERQPCQLGALSARGPAEPEHQGDQRNRGKAEDADQGRNRQQRRGPSR